MTRSEAKTNIDDRSQTERFLTPSGVRDGRASCLVCGARIGSGDPSIQILGALVHVHCAVRRRRLVRR